MGRGVVGSPPTVWEYAERYAADSSCNYFVAFFQRGDLTHQEASYFMELFAREVIPDFADAVVAGNNG